MQQQDHNLSPENWIEFVQQPSRCYFRSDSELKDESKGGYIQAKIRFRDIKVIDCIRICLRSGDGRQPQPCLLNLSSKNSHQNGKRKQSMGEKSWCVRLHRSRGGRGDGGLELDLRDHAYAGTSILKDEIWDECDPNVLVLGKGKLQITVTKPLTKGSRGSKSNSKHIMDVLENMKEEENINMDMLRMDEKDGYYRHHSEQEMHEARIHVKCTLMTEDSKCIVLQNVSSRFHDSFRYNARVDRAYPRFIVAEACPLRLITVVLPSSYKLPLNMGSDINLDTAFYIKNDHDREERLKDDEIPIRKVIRTTKGTYEVFYQVLINGSNRLLSGDVKELYLKLRIVRRGDETEEYEYGVSLIAIERICSGNHSKHCSNFTQLQGSGLITTNVELINHQEFRQIISMLDPCCELCQILHDTLEDYMDDESSTKKRGKRKTVNDDGGVSEKVTKQAIPSFLNVLMEPNPSAGSLMNVSGCVQFTPGGNDLWPSLDGPDSGVDSPEVILPKIGGQVEKVAGIGSEDMTLQQSGQLHRLSNIDDFPNADILSDYSKYLNDDLLEELELELDGPCIESQSLVQQRSNGAHSKSGTQPMMPNEMVKMDNRTQVTVTAQHEMGVMRTSSQPVAEQDWRDYINSRRQLPAEQRHSDLRSEHSFVGNGNGGIVGIWIGYIKEWSYTFVVLLAVLLYFFTK